tara:strand:- start:980 stop:1447 length:468 start_codon:yes stop_codon:yes gene_type:complete
MKAQLIGQVFIYVITIVIVSFILLLGYNAISSFNEKANQVSFLQFKNDLQNTVESLSFDFGSVKIRNFVLPDNIKLVCLVKNFPNMPSLSGTDYPIIENSVNSGVNKNVFLISQNIEESFYIENIDLSEDLFCKPVVGSEIKFKIEGLGDHALLS